jgi:hypothetical protein
MFGSVDLTNQWNSVACPQTQMVMRVDTNDLSWFGPRKVLLPSEEGWDLYYAHQSDRSRGYKHNGKGEDPKFQLVIEVSANTKWRRRLWSVCLPCLLCPIPKVMTVLFVGPRRVLRRQELITYCVLGLCFVAEGLLGRSGFRLKLLVWNSRRFLFMKLRYYKPT